MPDKLQNRSVCTINTLGSIFIDGARGQKLAHLDFHAGASRVDCVCYFGPAHSGRARAFSVTCPWRTWQFSIEHLDQFGEGLYCGAGGATCFLWVWPRHRQTYSALRRHMRCLSSYFTHRHEWSGVGRPSPSGRLAVGSVITLAAFPARGDLAVPYKCTLRTLISCMDSIESVLVLPCRSCVHLYCSLAYQLELPLNCKQVMAWIK